MRPALSETETSARVTLCAIFAKSIDVRTLDTQAECGDGAWSVRGRRRNAEETVHAPQGKRAKCGSRVVPVGFLGIATANLCVQVCCVSPAKCSRAHTTARSGYQAAPVRRKSSDIRANPINFPLARGEGAPVALSRPPGWRFSSSVRARGVPHVTSACLRSSIASAGDDRGVRAFGDLINDLSFITVVPVDFAVRRPSRRAPSLLRS